MTYQSTVLGLTPSLYLELQETSGTTAADASGNGDTGTYQGTITLGQTGSPADTHSVLLDGITAYISTAKSIAWTKTTPYSVVLWFKTATTNGGMLAVANNGTAADNYGIYMDTSGLVYASLYVGSGPGGNTSIATTTAYNDGKWHMLAVTYTGSVLTLYLDAVQKGSSSLANIASNSNMAWQFGYFSGDNYTNLSSAQNRYFNGYFSDISTWNTTALTSTQVQNLYNAATSSSGTANNVTLSDSVTTSDTIALVRNRNLSFADSVATSDALSLVRTLHVAISDSITSSDAIANAVSRVLTFSDAVSTSDSDTKAASEYLQDSIHATDAMAQVRTYFRNYADSIASSDNVTKQMARALAFSDGVTVTDALTAQKVTVYSIHLSDSVSVTDAITSLNRILSIALSDSISTSDSVTMTGGHEITTILEPVILQGKWDGTIALLGTFESIVTLRGEVPMPATGQNPPTQYQGTDWLFSITVIDSATGNAKDLSGAQQVEWVMQPNALSLTPTIKLTFGNGVTITNAVGGVIEVSVSNSQTSASNGVSSQSYYHAVIVTDATGIRKPVTIGTISVAELPA